MGEVFNYELDIEQVDLDEVSELARINQMSVLEELKAPLLDKYVDVDTVVKVSEGTGGTILKMRCLQNRQSVIVKVLKLYIDVIPSAFLTNGEISGSSSLSSAKQENSPVSRSHSNKTVFNRSVAAAAAASKDYSSNNGSLSPKPLSNGGKVLPASCSSSSSNSLASTLDSAEYFDSHNDRSAVQLDEVPLLKPDYVFDTLNEYIILKKVESKNIVPVYGLLTTNLLNESETNLCFMMDLYTDSDLLGFLTKIRKLGIPISEQLKSQLFLQIVQGVKFLHAKGIVHRDLKPENLLIDREGRLRLCDFGYAMDVARITEYPLDSVSFITRGTGSFKAPELLAFAKQSSDPNIEHSAFTEEKLKATDMWSVGVIYYQMKFLIKPWNIATYEDKDYHWFASTYRRCKLGTLKSGFDVKKKLQDHVSSSKSTVTTSKSSSTLTQNNFLSRANSTSSINRRMRSSSNASMLRAHSNTPSESESLIKSLISMKDSTIYTLIKVLNPDWASRIDAKTLLKCEWLVNTRLKEEENVKKARKEDDMKQILKMIRKA